MPAPEDKKKKNIYIYIYVYNLKKMKTMNNQTTFYQWLIAFLRQSRKQYFRLNSCERYIQFKMTIWYQTRSSCQVFVFYFPTDAATHFLKKLNPTIQDGLSFYLEAQKLSEVTRRNHKEIIIMHINATHLPNNIIFLARVQRKRPISDGWRILLPLKVEIFANIFYFVPTVE